MNPTQRMALPTVIFLLWCFGSSLPIAPHVAWAQDEGSETHESQAERPALQTECEESGFTQYSSYPNMIEFLRQVRASSTDMKLSSYGQSYEGRDLTLAIFSRPSVTQPWEAMVSGKPIVVLSANVHGGERTHRESLMILIRELATRGSEVNAFLDDLVILVAPSINPDGFTRASRGNAWGIDLNRDYMKLEQTALASLVKNIHQTWHPHLVVDGHNGGSYPYNICYQAGSNAAQDQRLTQLCDEEIFPLINKRMNEQGYKSFYYSGGNEEQWRTGGFDPRISRNYVCMTNAVGILFEAPRQDMETGVKSGVVGFKAVLEYARYNADKLMSHVNWARRETARRGDSGGAPVAVRMEYEAEPYPVSYEIARGRGPDAELIQVTDGKLIKRPVPLVTRTQPYAYLLPRDAVQAVALLKRHNITVEKLLEPVELEVEAYTLSDVRYRREYNHAAAVDVTVGEVITRSQRFPAGTYVIPTGQLMGRIATHLLEPETDDNVVHWNTMDAWLPRPAAPVSEPDTDTEADVGESPQDQAQTQQDSQALQDVTSQRAGRGARGQGGQRRGRGRRQRGPAVIPIYKLMQPTPLPAQILQD